MSIPSSRSIGCSSRFVRTLRAPSMVLIPMLLCLCPVVTMAQSAATSVAPVQQASGSTLKGELTAFEPFLGVWEIQANWSTGEPLHAISSYTPTLDGAAVELRTWVKNPDGTYFERYHSVLRHEEGRGLVTRDLIYDGTLRESTDEMEGQTLRTRWTQNGVTIIDTITLESDNTLNWQVGMDQDGSGSFEVIMNANWERRTQAQLAERLSQYVQPQLTGRSAELAPLIGSWEINGSWTDGRALVSRATYAPGPGGFGMVAHTYTIKPDGSESQRYLTLAIPADEPRTFVFYRFRYDGVLHEMVQRITSLPGEPLELETINPMPSEVAPNGQMRQRMSVQGDGAVRWIVHSRPDTSTDDWSLMTDSTWQKVPN
jgi:hypothetical protein